jgi:hypothetical protein
LGQSAVEDLRDAGPSVLGQCGDDLVLVSEATVGRTDADSRSRRDVVERDPKSLLCEERPSRVQAIRRRS